MKKTKIAPVYTCQLCGEKFFIPQALGAHKRFNHKGAKTPPVEAKAASTAGVTNGAPVIKIEAARPQPVPTSIEHLRQLLAQNETKMEGLRAEMGRLRELQAELSGLEREAGVFTTAIEQLEKSWMIAKEERAAIQPKAN